MRLFEAFGNNLSYKDILQLDGAFLAIHINYGKSPSFNGINCKLPARFPRKENASLIGETKDAMDNIRIFNGTEKSYNRGNRELLWKDFWLEYINAFNKLTTLLPESVVTTYIGRQAIEIGFKYLLFKKTNRISFTHKLNELSNNFFSEYTIDSKYMQWVNDFCEAYSNYIEGGNVEYFRYPEYKNNAFFAGDCLDIKWLSYNFALILLKLLHFAELDVEA